MSAFQTQATLVQATASYLDKKLERDPRYCQPKSPTIDRGPSRVAKYVVVKLEPPGRLHLAAAGEYNRVAEAREAVADVLTSLALEEDGMTASLEVRSLPNEWTPLQHCARTGVVDDLHRLIELGADVNTRDKHGSTPLHNACRDGSVEKLEALVNGNAPLREPITIMGDGACSACRTILRLPRPKC